jgi:hypothetical protein
MGASLVLDTRGSIGARYTPIKRTICRVTFRQNIEFAKRG